MKTLDHAFNVDGVEKVRPKMERDAEIRADVRECVAACQHHQKRVCTKTAWSVPCVCPKPQECREECWCTTRSAILFGR